MSDVVYPGFMSAAECAALRAALRCAADGAASVSGISDGRRVERYARRAALLQPDAGRVAAMAQQLAAWRERLVGDFGRALTHCEPPQFLRYGPGDFFVAHQDGNTSLLRDHTRHRKVSVIVFLSPPDDYRGGELLLHARGGAPRAAAAEAGSLLAFPSELTHEVAPLTGGERFSVVTWFRDDPPPAA